jgi:phosphoglycolate phosphatase-like HAD superfamily hydrolase
MATERRNWQSVTVRIFFDIDATLLLTDGAGRAALRAALEVVYGSRGQLDGYLFHGKTDPQIVVELLEGSGMDEAEIRERMPAMWPVYLEALQRELDERRSTRRIKILPGVAELLAELDGAEGVSLGLITGNIEAAARMKLAAAGVKTRFAVGGYGSDAEVRSEIARIALDRSRSRLEWNSGEDVVVVVGDTPEDIACARCLGGRAVAVATGRHSVEELEQAGADVVFSDFGDTGAVLNGILHRPAAGTSGVTDSGGDR